MKQSRSNTPARVYQNWTSVSFKKGICYLNLVFSIPVGKITRVIKSGDAYHIFYVKEHMEPSIKPFEESLPEVRELYLKESADKLYDEWLSKVKEKYVIKIIDKELN